jgi:hypothetical protein
VLEHTRDARTFGVYAELSATLTASKTLNQVRNLFELLKHPLTAGKPTEKLLRFLEEVPGVNTKFGGDLWKAVEWAMGEQKSGRLIGLDLDAPLQVK